MAEQSKDPELIGAENHVEAMRAHLLSRQFSLRNELERLKEGEQRIAAINHELRLIDMDLKSCDGEPASVEPSAE